MTRILQGRAVTWVRGFVKCFLRCSAASLLRRQARETLRKLFTKPLTQVTARPCRRSKCPPAYPSAPFQIACRRRCCNDIEYPKLSAQEEW